MFKKNETGSVIDYITLIFEKIYPEINNIIQYTFVQKEGRLKTSDHTDKNMIN